MILIVKSMKVIVTVLVAFVLLNSCALPTSSCTKNWTITGYFTPFESDYPATPKQSIYIEGIGKRQFSQQFLKAVKIEGWGRTNEGWYLGFFSKKWHRSQQPLNAGGGPLKIGSIATDQQYIERGQQVRIPTLPEMMRHKVFTADDVGSAIKRQHIDIYTGEGKQAEKLSWKITGKQHTVCKL